MPGSMCDWGLFKFESDIDEFGRVFSFEEFGNADADLRHVFPSSLAAKTSGQSGVTSTTALRDWLNAHSLTATLRVNPLPRGKRTH